MPPVAGGALPRVRASGRRTAACPGAAAHCPSATDEIRGGDRPQLEIVLAARKGRPIRLSQQGLGLGRKRDVVEAEIGRARADRRRERRIAMRNAIASPSHAQARLPLCQPLRQAPRFCASTMTSINRCFFLPTHPGSCRYRMGHDGAWLAGPVTDTVNAATRPSRCHWDLPPDCMGEARDAFPAALAMFQHLATARSSTTIRHARVICRAAIERQSPSQLRKYHSHPHQDTLR